MVKNILMIITFSVIAMLIDSNLGHILRYILMVHDKIADSLGAIFSNAPAGRMIQETIALIIIPVICGVIVALIYWLVKRHEMPHIIASVWVAWVILVVTMVSQPEIHHATNGHAKPAAHHVQLARQQRLPQYQY
jgi:hypothetical protein